MDFIPVNEPLIDGNEKKYLIECIESGWISSEGPFVRKFEEQFAARVCRKHAIAVTNGTAAIDVAVEALGIGPGDEVILPSFTIISVFYRLFALAQHRCWWILIRFLGTLMFLYWRRR